MAGLAVTVMAAGSVLVASGQAQATDPSAIANKGVLTLTNLDGLPNWPMPEVMAFNRIQTRASSSEAVHDTATTRLSNTGTSSITVSKLTLSGPFALVSAPKLPITIGSGNHLDVKIKFTAVSGGSKGSEEKGALKITSNAGTNPTPSITLDGWWQNLSEHVLEPFIPNLKDMFGLFVALPANMHDSGEVKTFSSDELLSPYWVKRDPSKPVTVNEIASFHTFPLVNTLTWYSKGNSGTQHAFSTAGKYQAQSVLPRTASTSTPTAPSSGSVNPTGAFGLRVDAEYGDPALNDQKVDRSKGCTTTLCGNHVRVFQLHNHTGTLRGGSYLVVEDANGVNYDYNDNVYILNNVKPAS